MTRIVCAWCGALIAPGGTPVSHGICPACESRLMVDPIPADADVGSLRDLLGHSDRDEPPWEPDYDDSDDDPT